MPRKEFTRSTKRAALARSELKCEAEGKRYGFEEGQRCNCNLSLGVQFDHVLPCEMGGDNDISNCSAICIQCHKYATRGDVRQVRKSDRQRDKASGVIRAAGKIKSAGFPASSKTSKRSSKLDLPPLPRASLYQESER